MCGGGVGMQNIVHIHNTTEIYGTYVYDNWKFRNS